MNLEKFTERSRGFLQAAQTIAMREDHQRVMPEHLLKAIMDDSEGLASNLISKAGGAPARVREAVDIAVTKLPQVSGDTGQPYIDKSLAKVLAEAESLASKAGDSFVPVERVLMALAMVKSAAKEALEKAAGKSQAPCLSKSFQMSEYPGGLRLDPDSDMMNRCSLWSADVHDPFGSDGYAQGPKPVKAHLYRDAMGAMLNFKECRHALTWSCAGWRCACWRRGWRR
mgnify:CR=1 FL=1